MRRWGRAYGALCVSGADWPGIEERLKAQDSLMLVRSRTLAERAMERDRRKRDRGKQTELLWAACVVAAALGWPRRYERVYAELVERSRSLDASEPPVQSEHALKERVTSFIRGNPQRLYLEGRLLSLFDGFKLYEWDRSHNLHRGRGKRKLPVFQDGRLTLMTKEEEELVRSLLPVRKLRRARGGCRRRSRRSGVQG